MFNYDFFKITLLTKDKSKKSSASTVNKDDVYSDAIEEITKLIEEMELKQKNLQPTSLDANMLKYMKKLCNITSLLVKIPMTLKSDDPFSQKYNYASSGKIESVLASDDIVAKPLLFNRPVLSNSNKSRIQYTSEDMIPKKKYSAYLGDEEIILYKTDKDSKEILVLQKMDDEDNG